MSHFDGESAGGTWTLDLRDDTAGANGGTLTSWGLRVCEPVPAPTCGPGFTAQTVHSTDFESGAAGYTHSGVQDEWELGLPATVATTTANPVAGFTTCNSGVNCWKTDLDNSYNASSSQDLLSPNINLAGLSPPVIVTWAQRHQVETANFDHFFIDYQQVGGATPNRLYEWKDPTIISASAGTGNPQTNIGGSAGWGVFSRRVDSLAGLNTELRFHLDSDTTVQFGGVAIDDVTVTACRALSADLSITKTDGVTTAVPGGSVTYTITASNAGADPVTGATVADTFPAALTCTWTCAGAGGGTCTAAGAGNINDSVNLPTGGSVTYTASCAISASATGTLANTATVTSAITDPNPGNNSATDSDTLTPQADLSITKTNGVINVAPGGSTTYTIVASNAGPSDAGGSTVADTFPADLTCTWTCVGAGGGACTAAGSGNINDTAGLPAGASATYTASCAISGTATGTISNTATVAAPGGVTDPTPGNNSATDTDTVSPQADLSITKTDGVASVTAGGTTTYTIIVNNAGPSNAFGSRIIDTFPAGLSCNWTCSNTVGSGCSTFGIGNFNDAVNIAVGGTLTYTVVCNVSASATGTIANTAQANTSPTVTDPNLGNNTATDTDTVLVNADLAITKTDGQTSVGPGSTLTYTIAASNAGPSDASATVSDTAPTECTSFTWTCAGASGGTCSAGGSGSINDAVALPVGASVTYTAACVLNGAVLNATVSNTASIALGGGGTDPTPGNNSAVDTTQVLGTPDVTGTKTASGLFLPGGAITYSIVLSNAGLGPQNDNAGDEFTDVLPAGITGTGVTASAGTATLAGNTVSWNGSLAAGASVTLTISATINGNASGTILNQGTINTDLDANGSNETQRLTDDPSIVGPGQPTGIVVAAAIPTLGRLGLILMALVLVGFAWQRSRRPAVLASRR
ncbi:MAG: DUF11 domain-containing protein [Ahniella sp.]|nr:DUF11 domain-containing protein [Ahniella sp.]